MLNSSITNPAITRSLWHVVFGTVSMALVTLSGCFDYVKVETGLSHYAEKPFWGREDVLPAWLPMPANSVVNLGYVLVGLYWIAVIRRINQMRPTVVNEHDAYVFYVFSWMSILYGFVQCSRILAQHQLLAVLDQWYTMPIFAWVGVWSCHILFGWNTFRMLAIIIASVSTYMMSIVSRFGFEIALTCHIFAVIFCAMAVYKRNPTHTTQAAFIKGVICCAGFVVLKLLDETLAEWSVFFTYLSGHFWSKIADFLQVHYTCLFFLSSTEKLHSV